MFNERVCRSLSHLIFVHVRHYSVAGTYRYLFKIFIRMVGIFLAL